jgi:Na+-transporting methylmalonyl-CoA/oxaloacetate decarboxylase gamma subunit
VLAFTIVFVVLSILAISISIMSKLTALRKREKVKEIPPPKTGKVTRVEGARLTEEDLRGAAVAIASLHHMLKTAAAVAALHHHLTLRRASIRVPSGGLGVSPWVISWLNEITYKPELNPYLRRRGVG